MLVSRRRTGACNALRWLDDEKRYTCGMVSHPSQHLVGRALPWLDPLLRRWSLRWIAAGSGCDALLQTGPP
jgi:hypothetical protein